MKHDPKPRPNQRLYLQVLRGMTPEQRLLKVFELSAMTKELFRTGLRIRYPEASDEEIQHLLIERLAQCHNTNY